MFTLYHNVETEDGEYSENCRIEDVWQLARETWTRTHKPVVLETVLEKDGEIYYGEDGQPVVERLPLIGGGAG